MIPITRRLRHNSGPPEESLIFFELLVDLFRLTLVEVYGDSLSLVSPSSKMKVSFVCIKQDPLLYYKSLIILLRHTYILNIIRMLSITKYFFYYSL